MDKTITGDSNTDIDIAAVYNVSFLFQTRMEGGFLGGGDLGGGGPRMRYRRDVVEDVEEGFHDMEEEVKEIEHQMEEELAPVAETLHVAPW